MSQDRTDPWDLVDLADALARVAHAGQRRDTEPYFHHCQRVASAAWEETGSTIAYMAGYLHDIIEDTQIHPVTLREIGFPPETVAAVGALTRQPGATYANYIFSLLKHGSDDALVVKLADLEDNLRDQENESLRHRYLKAKKLIIEEQARRRRTAAVANHCIHAERKAVVG